MSELKQARDEFEDYIGWKPPRWEHGCNGGTYYEPSMESRWQDFLQGWNRRTQPEATKPAQDLGAAIRLRLVCKLLGLEGAVPEDDADLWGCAFSVLGMIRSKLEEQKPIGFVVQHDTNGGNFFTGVTSFEGMRKTYGMAAKLVFGVPVNNLSNAILALPCKAEGSTLPLQQHYVSGFMAALDAAAALASPANALSAGDRVDAERYRFLRDHGVPETDAEIEKALTVYQGVSLSSLLPGELDSAIDAAIQAQKDGQ